MKSHGRREAMEAGPRSAMRHGPSYIRPVASRHGMEIVELAAKNRPLATADFLCESHNPGEKETIVEAVKELHPHRGSGRRVAPSKSSP